MLKINIVCDDIGWIYSEFVEKIKHYSKHTVMLNSKEKCDLTHYLPYYSVPKPKHIQHPITIWSSHQEIKEPLKSKFISSAKIADWCLSPSLKYMKVLQNSGVSKVSKINHGVDLDLYKPRDVLKSSVNKLIVGWVGRSYSSTSRKNEQLLQKISKLDFVNLVITGGKIKKEDMPKFYSGLDLIISPSIVEGGPLAITEGLACGVPILCYKNVGVANEFEYGVIRVDMNEQKFIERLKDFWNNKEFKFYQKLEQIQLLRSQVINHTWENFVLEHDKIWEQLCE